MATLETTINAPLRQWEDGSIRIGGSRVPIDTRHLPFQAWCDTGGDRLQVHVPLLSGHLGVIYYCLAHREQVEAYLRQQEAEADAVQQRIESDPDYQKWKVEMRDRLLKRRAEKNTPVNPPAAN